MHVALLSINRKQLCRSERENLAVIIPQNVAHISDD